MSLSKDLKKYPPEFFMLADAFETRKRFEVPTKGTREGNALRFKLYGFKRALTEAGMEAAYPNFLSSEIIVYVDKLVVQLPEDSSMMDAVREALGAPTEGRLNPTVPSAPKRMLTEMSAEEVEAYMKAPKTAAQAAIENATTLRPGAPLRLSGIMREVSTGQPSTDLPEPDHAEDATEAFLKPDSDPPK